MLFLNSGDRNGHKNPNRNQSPKLRANSPRGGHGPSHRTHSPKMNHRNLKYETYANSNHVMSVGQSNHTSHHTGGQKYRQGDHREHREHHEHPNKTNNEHDRVVFLKEEESFSGNHLQGGSHQGNTQVHGEMNELSLLDWNTPRNLNKGRSLSFIKISFQHSGKTVHCTFVRLMLESTRICPRSLTCRLHIIF